VEYDIWVGVAFDGGEWILVIGCDGDRIVVKQMVSLLYFHIKIGRQFAARELNFN